MLSSNFALSRLLRKKLKEVIQYSEDFLGYKYVKVRRTGKVLLAKNIFQFIFKPVKLNLNQVLSHIDTHIVNDTSIPEKIDVLYTAILAKKYNLTQTKEPSLTLRALLRMGALTDSRYAEGYINLIYGYVKDKYSANLLSIIEILTASKNVVRPSADRTDKVVINAILRSLSLLRAPPNRVTIGLLRVA